MRSVLVAIYLCMAHSSATETSLLENLLPITEFQQYGSALEAIFSMGVRLQALLNSTSTKQNFVMSPLSTTTIVGQLMIGAEGRFLDDLYGLLSLPKLNSSISRIEHYGRDKNNISYNIGYGNFHLQLSGLVKSLQKRKGNEKFVLNQNNALFYNDEIELHEYFTRFLQSFYSTEIVPLDFSSGNTSSIINKWASRHTNGLINNVPSSSPSLATSSIFLNAIYFSAEWETPFSDQYNKIDKFNIDETSTVNITYMLGLLEEIPYADGKGYRTICLPYKNRELGMYIITPNQEHEEKFDMTKFVKNLDPREIIETINAMKNKDVVLKIPKLSLSNTMSILEPLQRYEDFKKGETKIKIKIESREGDVIDNIRNRINVFENFTAPTRSDILLTGAAKNANLKVSDIVQQMVFSINEVGTEAASVTSGITNYIGGQKTVVLDRPFVFFIRHESTLATIFWGTISDPSKN